MKAVASSVELAEAGRSDDTTTTTAPVKFSLPSLLSNKRSIKSIADDDHPSKNQRDDLELITDITDGTIHTNRPRPSNQPLVLPLDGQSHSKRIKVDANDEISIKKEELTEDERVAAELIKEAISGGIPSSSASNSSLVLPILLQNRMEGIENIEDDDERFKYDISNRPDESTLEEYESVPIEDFGTAMLRGMGWDPVKSNAIGVDGRAGLAEPIEYVKRPGFRLGLGATPQQQVDAKLEKEKRSKRRILKPGESAEPPPIMVAPSAPDGKVRHVKSIHESLVPLRTGIYEGLIVRIAAGKHEGLRGKVIKLDEGDALVRLNNDEKIWVKKLDISESNGRHHHHHGKKRDRDDNQKTTTTTTDKGWIRSDIMVKIISKSYHDGKYYNKRGTVIDASSRKGSCSIQLEEGRLLENVKQDFLETVIPKPGGRIIVVMGGDTGSTGTLLERKQDDTGVVQLSNDLSIKNFPLDSIAQFVGRNDVEDD